MQVSKGIGFYTELEEKYAECGIEEKFSHYFDDCSIFMIPGRMFPVDILYTKVDVIAVAHNICQNFKNFYSLELYCFTRQFSTVRHR